MFVSSLCLLIRKDGKEFEEIFGSERDQNRSGGKQKITNKKQKQQQVSKGAKSKEDEAYREEAMEMTRLLQDGDKGVRALWQEIMKVSVADLKKVYGMLSVTFDLWKGEADVHDEIPQMIEEMKRAR